MNFGYPKLFTDIRNYLRISVNKIPISVYEFRISVNSDYLHGMLAIVFYTFDPKIQKFAKGF